MSVRIESRETFASIHRIAQGLVVTLDPRWPDGRRFGLYRAFRALHIAQHAAYAMSYDTDTTARGTRIAPPFAWNGLDDATFPADPASTREFVKALRMLRYNAVSNGGSNFLPEQWAGILSEVERRALDRLGGLS